MLYNSILTCSRGQGEVNKKSQELSNETFAIYQGHVGELQAASAPLPQSSEVVATMKLHFTSLGQRYASSQEVLLLPSVARPLQVTTNLHEHFVNVSSGECEKAVDYNEDADLVEFMFQVAAKAAACMEHRRKQLFEFVDMSHLQRVGSADTKQLFTRVGDMRARVRNWLEAQVNSYRVFVAEDMPRLLETLKSTNC